MLLYTVMFAGLFIIFVMQFGLTAVHAQAPVNVEQTARNIYDKIQGPLLYIAGAALAIGACLFMFARGNAERTRQARMGLGVAVAGFVIGFFALGILEFAKGLIAA